MYFISLKLQLQFFFINVFPFPKLLNMTSTKKCYIFQNCLLMTIGLLHTTLNSLSYSAATAIIRYVYVRSSLQNSVQEVLKRNAFMFKLIFIVEFFGLFNVFSLYIMQRGKSGAERLPFLVYQTCLNPWSKCTQNLFKTMPVTYSILTLAADGCIIYFNIYLYTFLDKQSRENTGETYSANLLSTRPTVLHCQAPLSIQGCRY